MIVADPAWPFRDKLRQSDTKRGAADQYQIMSLDDIRALPVARLCAENAVLLLWVTSSHLFEAPAILTAWGFRYTQTAVWGKVQKSDPTKPKIGMGRLFRQSTDFAVIGVRGKAHSDLWVKGESNLWLEPAAAHSVKPESVQTRLERMFPTYDRRLELFARRKRRGWVCLGNEIDGKDLRRSVSTLARGVAA